MNNDEIISQLKKATGAYEVHHKTFFHCSRQAKDGTDQAVTIEIWDAGPDVNPNIRYTCVARADDGREALGNSDDSIEHVIDMLHWGDLDGEITDSEHGEGQNLMNPEAMSEALNAITDEALKLLGRDDLPEEVEQGLERILAIARYEHDVRTDAEKRAAEEIEEIPEQ